MAEIEMHLPRNADQREILTYSALSTFRNCGRKFDLRYQHWLRGERDAEPLHLGTLVHSALEYAYNAAKEGKLEAEIFDAAMLAIDRGCHGHEGDELLHARWHQARAMLTGYLRRWRALRDPLDQVLDNEFEILTLEKHFQAPITNPETKHASRTFVISGVVDGVIRLKSDGRLYVLERKTAASIDAGYLAKLWTDFQSMLYAHYLGKHVYKEQFAGVLYDVVGKKTRIKQKQPETQFEFEGRILAFEPTLKRKEPESEIAFCDRLLAYKSDATREKHEALGPKKGDTDEEFAARIQASKDKHAEKEREKGPKKGDTDEEFAARLDAYFEQPQMMHRELITFDAERLEMIEEEVWDLTKQILAARGRNRFTMNTTNCYVFGRGCDFVQVCRAGELNDVTQIGLETHPPHGELSQQTERKPTLKTGELPPEGLDFSNLPNLF